MAISDFLSKLRRTRRGQSTATDGTADCGDAYSFDFDDKQVNFRVSPELFAQLNEGGGSDEALDQHILLELLEEQHIATRRPNGFSISAEDAVRLDSELQTLLQLPERFPGELRTEVSGNTTSRRFAITPLLHHNGHRVPVQRSGPSVRVGEDEYLLSPPALSALTAIERHTAEDPGGLSPQEVEQRNVTLLAELQSARTLAHSPDPEVSDPLLHLDLGHLEKFHTLVPDRIGVTVEPQEDGSLLLAPDFGSATEPADLRARTHQLDSSSVIRIDQQLVLLDEKKRKAARAVLSRGRIAPEDRADFLRAPGEFLPADEVDIDITFSVRVEGIGALVPLSFSDASESGIDWISQIDRVISPAALAQTLETTQEVEEVEEKFRSAWRNDEAFLTHGERVVSAGTPEEVQPALDHAKKEVERRAHASEAEAEADSAPGTSVTVGMVIADSAAPTHGLEERAAAVASAHSPDLTGLKFTPFRHQRDGIAWAAGMMAASLSPEDPVAPGRIQGALFADDMGLGKTFMTLVALRDFAQHQRRLHGTAKPILAVLPLSLIENWEQELTRAFEENPFPDTVVLQSDRDLSRFRLPGRGRETTASAAALDDRSMVREDALKLSLRVGDPFGEARLDAPDRLVLTTYQALASYQLSLGQVQWSAVVFDEAQTLKNPQSLTARAAKGLQADFKLLATGTPVENKLQDIWTLMDTAQPGLLGTWPDFRSTWVSTSKDRSSAEASDSGRALRTAIGTFMLRRTKEDTLEGLPSKTVHTGSPNAQTSGATFDPRLSAKMPPVQMSAYDDVIDGHSPVTGSALETIQKLRAVSLHPCALQPSMNDAEPLESARMHALFAVLDSVRTADEKVIVFVINKKMQVKLAAWLHERYGIRPAIVNGETPAMAARHAGAEPTTRKEIISAFESREGFNIIIMSPLAVGTGLTVVGANHAVHLERHWNPAKEAQATDRIFRIGQTRDVHVYLPLAVHPTLTSFDLNLDELLRSKNDLKDAVVVPGTVERELIDRLGISESSVQAHPGPAPAAASELAQPQTARQVGPLPTQVVSSDSRSSTPQSTPLPVFGPGRRQNRRPTP